MTTTFNQFRFFTMLGLALVLALGACNRDEEDDPVPEQPELPPENMFVQDLSGFGSANPNRSEINYNYAALNVGVWNTVLFLNLALPVRAWEEVRKAQPQWDAVAEAWVWTKEFNNTYGNYTARLHGWVEDKNAEWRMYVSHQGHFNDFLWYKGQSQLNQRSGNWRLFREPANDEPYIDINWRNSVSTSYDTITYTNAIPNNAGKGGYINYGRGEDPQYEAFYNIYTIENDKLIEIDYNDSSTAGRVRDSVFFGDNLWRCWDELKQDTICQ